MNSKKLNGPWAHEQLQLYFLNSQRQIFVFELLNFFLIIKIYLNKTIIIVLVLIMVFHSYYRLRSLREAVLISSLTIFHAADTKRLIEQKLCYLNIVAFLTTIIVVKWVIFSHFFYMKGEFSIKSLVLSIHVNYLLYIFIIMLLVLVNYLFYLKSPNMFIYALFPNSFLSFLHERTEVPILNYLKF